MVRLPKLSQCYRTGASSFGASLDPCSIALIPFPELSQCYRTGASSFWGDRTHPSIPKITRVDSLDAIAFTTWVSFFLGT